MGDFNLNDIIRVGAVMKFKGAYDIANVWTGKITLGGDVSYTTMYGYAAEWMDLIYAEIAAVLSDEMLPDYLTLSNITQDTVGGAFAWDDFAGGGSSGDPTPAQVACLGYARTQVPRVQLRKYLGVFTELGLGEGLWLSTVSSPVTDCMGVYIAPAAVGGGVQITGVAWNEAAARATLGRTSHASIAPVIQRRRREGRGS